MGMTSVDLREIAPSHRPVLRAAIRRAYERAAREGRFENLHAGDDWWAGWLSRFGDLVQMLAPSAAGEAAGSFNPHMRALGHRHTLDQRTRRHEQPGETSSRANAIRAGSTARR